MDNTLITPGEQIGIRLAHRVLADLTQDSLSSFHSAGLEGSNQSSQSLQDIIDGVDNKGSMTIALVNPKNIEKLKRQILYRPLKYYISRVTSSMFEPILQDSKFWYDIGYKLDILESVREVPINNPIVVRFYFDYRKLKEDNQTLEYIVNTIFQNVDYVFYSPDFIGIVDIYIAAMVELSGVIQLVDENLGIKNINKCTIVGNNIVTSGSNLEEICTQQYVDSPNTISTDIYDVEQVFGLEAARHVIYTEIYNKCGDKRSASFMADFMTCKGLVSPFKKGNPILKDKGFLTSIAFERPKKDIKDILSSGDTVDLTSSVYSQLVTGEKPNIGTGSILFDVIEKS